MNLVQSTSRQDFAPDAAKSLAATAADREIASILALTRAIFDAPLALLTLVDVGTIDCNAVAGVDCEIVRDDGTFYNLPATANQLLVFGDAALDPRFDGKRLAVDGPGVRFCAGAPLSLGNEGALGALSIIDTRPRRLEREELELLAQIAKLATSLLPRSRHAEAVARVNKRHDANHRYKKMYERSSALAKIGVWECDLASEALTWTDGVYDIFELPRGTALTRARTLELYEEQSRIEMQRLRSKAIAECGSFCLDIQIGTAKGNRRWVRLSADVECENGAPVRIFGLKQDITKEKELLEGLKRLAECDPLTGIANRAVFQARLHQSTEPTQAGEPLGALVLIDLDGFKQINDTHGHMAGDECLTIVAQRLQSLFEPDVLVARLGGDEFAVLFQGSRERERLEADARRIISEIRRPVRWNGNLMSVSASVGIAMRTATVDDPNHLFRQADLALYAAKKAGRNTLRMFETDDGRKTRDVVPFEHDRGPSLSAFAPPLAS